MHAEERPSRRGLDIRIGQRWINTLWGFPIGAAALLCLIAIAQSLRELPSVTAFIQLPKRRSVMEGSMVGLGALDLILRNVRAGIMGIAFRWRACARG